MGDYRYILTIYFKSNTLFADNKLMTQSSWMKQFNINKDKLLSWKVEPANEIENLLFNVLEQKHLDEDEYLKWAMNQYKLPLLDPSYLNHFSVDPIFWKQMSNLYQGWGKHLMPLYEWKGTVYLVCLEPQEIPWSFDYQYILASPKTLNSLWNIIAESIEKEQSSEVSPEEDSQSASESIDQANVINLELTKDPLPPELPGETGISEALTVAKEPEGLSSEDDLKVNKVAQVEPIQKKPHQSLELDDDEISEVLNHEDEDENENEDEDLEGIEVETPIGLSLGSQKIEAAAFEFKPVAMGLEKESVVEPETKQIVKELTPQKDLDQSSSKHLKNKLVNNEVEKSMTAKAKNESELYKLFLKSQGTVFSEVAILLFNDLDLSVECIYPDENKKSQWNLSDFNSPSIFRIVIKSKQPYHGYMISNKINETFFKSLGYANLPEHITLLPLKEGNKLWGMFLGVGDSSCFQSKILDKLQRDYEHFQLELDELRNNKEGNKAS